MIFFKHKDNPTSEEVIKKYKDMVYKLAYSQLNNKQDADDMFQEVFLSYLKDVTEYQNEEHLKRWLIRTTINKCKNLKKSS